VLRGPQGTLYGAGSMGGTIKLVTNPPKLSTFEEPPPWTSLRPTRWHQWWGNLMLNFPIGDKAALRFVTTDKYISGWIDRKVIAEFPFPTNFGNCGFYFCTRGDVADSSVTQDIKGSNLERFVSARATLLVNPVMNYRSPVRSCISASTRTATTPIRLPRGRRVCDLSALRHSRAVPRYVQARELESQLRHGHC